MAIYSRYWGRVAIAAGIYCVATAIFFAPLLRCDNACTLDPARWSTHMVELGKADIRLNTWILSWVQHALITQPGHLFDANAFYPSPQSLAGSEHMLAPALLAMPVRLFSTNANLIYNATTMLSFVVAGVTTYALAYALTANVWLALWAGLVGMFMPWRLTELVHIQLLFACWLPLVWLLTARCLLDPLSVARTISLGAAWAALIFSSYYLAYFGCFSTAAFALTIIVLGRTRASCVLATGVALAVPIILLAALSLPYLQARDASDLAHSKYALQFVPLDGLLGMLAPHLPEFLERHVLPWSGGYSLPATVLLSACFAAVRPARRAGNADGTGGDLFSCEQRPVIVAALFAVSVVSLVMSLGRWLVFGHVSIPLPSLWIARIVPGFDFIRALTRWTILLATALPVLAAVGLLNAQRLLHRYACGRAGVAMVGMAALIAVVECVPPSLPVTDAYDAEASAAYSALAELPPGPVLELPWPRQGLANAVTSSRYMVASTRHWHPLLNGYSGYKPRTYDFLVRVGSRLPDKRAIEQISALTGLRWIVVHLDQLEPRDGSRWSSAQIYGPLVPAYRDLDTAIYEVAEWRSGGTLRERLLLARGFADTFNGLARIPLEIGASDGSLRTLAPTIIERYPDGWIIQPVAVQITNDTSRAWPGLDPDPIGLAYVKYSIVRPDAREILTGESALDDDVMPHTTILTQIGMQGDVDPGSYNLCVKLGQHLPGGSVTLGLPRACQAIQVVDPRVDQKQ